MAAFFAFLCLIVLLAAWAAIPLLPAILIYRIFPDAPFLAGGQLPGTGLKINAGGASAAYIVLFLLMYPLVDTAKNQIGSLNKPYWEITGVARFINEGKDFDPPDRILKDMELKAAPSNLSHNGSVLTLQIPEGIARTFPRVTITFPDYPEWTGHLDLTETIVPRWRFWSYNTEKNMIVDPFFKEITVNEITVRKTPPPRTYDSMSPMDRPKDNPNS
jgi:hypothetical protein